MKINQKILIAIGLVIIGVIGRLVPHLWNMTPIAALAILAGAKLGFRFGVVVAFLGMFIGDLIIGFYTPEVMVAVYFSLAIAGLIGYFLKKTNKVGAIISGSMIGTTIFFPFTNYAVWQWTTMYGHNLSGLMASYIAGLPFFANQIIGDMFFTVGLFAVWELVSYMVTRSKLVKAEKCVIVN